MRTYNDLDPEPSLARRNVPMAELSWQNFHGILNLDAFPSSLTDAL